MENYIAKDNKPSGTENNAGIYSNLRKRALASVLALGLAGCAAGIDVKNQLRSKTDANQAYSQSFEVGRRVGTAEKVYNVVTPWNMLIDNVDYTKLWEQANKVICEKGGLRKAAEQALNAYTASAQDGVQLIDAPRIANEITKAGCEDYSRRDLSNALSKVPSNHLLHPLAKNLDAILENDEGFMKNTYNGGDFVIEGVEVKGDDNKAAPELRLAIRRGADIAILGVIGAAAAGAFSGGGAGFTPGKGGF